jgi:hypothetical protein
MAEEAVKDVKAKSSDLFVPQTDEDQLFILDVDNYITAHGVYVEKGSTSELGDAAKELNRSARLLFVENWARIAEDDHDFRESFLSAVSLTSARIVLCLSKHSLQKDLGHWISALNSIIVDQVNKAGALPAKR